MNKKVSTGRLASHVDPKRGTRGRLSKWHQHWRVHACNGAPLHIAGAVYE